MKKHIAAALVLTTPLQANPWVGGTLDGINTLITISDRIILVNNDYEDSNTQVFIASYRYDTAVNYWKSNLSYYSYSKVFITLGGAYIYGFYFYQNGALTFSSPEPFEVGLVSGSPITKRNWSCSIITPDTHMSAWSSSMTVFRIQHQVTQQAKFISNAPLFNDVFVQFRGTQLASDCGGAGGPWTMKFVTKTVPRNQHIDFHYPHENLLVEELSGKIER